MVATTGVGITGEATLHHLIAVGPLEVLRSLVGVFGDEATNDVHDGLLAFLALHCNAAMANPNVEVQSYEHIVVRPDLLRGGVGVADGVLGNCDVEGIVGGSVCTCSATVSSVLLVLKAFAFISIILLKLSTLTAPRADTC